MYDVSIVKELENTLKQLRCSLYLEDYSKAIVAILQGTIQKKDYKNRVALASILKLQEELITLSKLEDNLESSIFVYGFFVKILLKELVKHPSHHVYIELFNPYRTALYHFDGTTRDINIINACKIIDFKKNQNHNNYLLIQNDIQDILKKVPVTMIVNEAPETEESSWDTISLSSYDNRGETIESIEVIENFEVHRAKELLKDCGELGKKVIEKIERLESWSNWGKRSCFFWPYSQGSDAKIEAIVSAVNHLIGSTEFDLATELNDKEDSDLYNALNLHRLWDISSWFSCCVDTRTNTLKDIMKLVPN